MAIFSIVYFLIFNDMQIRSNFIPFNYDNSVKSYEMLKVISTVAEIRWQKVKGCIKLMRFMCQFYERLQNNTYQSVVRLIVSD